MKALTQQIGCWLDGLLAGIGTGTSLDAIQASRPTASHQQRWGGVDAGGALVAVVYSELQDMD